MPSSRSRATIATAMISSRPRSSRRRPRGGRARQTRRNSPPTRRCLIVADVLEALRDLARAARARSRRRSSPSPAAPARPAPRKCCASRFRAAARRMPRPPPTTIIGACRCPSRACRRRAKYGVFEIGMNHAGEIRRWPIRAPACGAHHHHRAGASGIFRHARSHRRRQVGNLRRPRAGRRGRDHRDNAHMRSSPPPRKRGRRRAHRRRSAKTPRPMRGLCASLQPDGSTVEARILGDAVNCKLGAPGHAYRAQCAGRAGGGRAGRRRSGAGRAALENLKPARAAARASLRRRRQRAVIDESYNANPASMAAALALLGQAPVGRRAAASRCWATCWNWAPRARRCIAVWPRRSRRPASIWSSAAGRR